MSVDVSNVNYALYLVTDSTAGILKGRDLVEVVEAAIQGGVTIVQYRDKHNDTSESIRVANALHEVTLRHEVPLIINDRVDVALAVGAEGVHIGQEDMSLATARKLMGKDAIVGVTVSTIEEASRAADGGATYLGIGTMFATPTKTNTKTVIGTAGTRDILESLTSQHRDLPTVSIGGINASNFQRVMFQSRASSKGLDGVAVVSAIIAADDPKEAAATLQSALQTPPAFTTTSGASCVAKDRTSLLDAVPSAIRAVGEKSPLCHNMTNLVVQNFAANVLLAVGGSPIMANYGHEAEDLAKLGGSLVINMGTVSPEGLENYLLALRAYNAQGGPVLLDPVGAGATGVRRDAVKTLMAGGYFDVIKGNEGEIKTVSGESGVQQRGVDSGDSTLSPDEKAQLVKKIAARERNIVLMTGKIDFVSDGERTVSISNGHEYLGKITGSGCTLGSTIAACLAAYREDKFVAVVAAILLFEIAAEYAARRWDVKGPGTFVPAFIDELHTISQGVYRGAQDWMADVKVEFLDV